MNPTSPDATSAEASTGIAAPSPSRLGAEPSTVERKAVIVCIIAIIAYLVLAYLVFVRSGVQRKDHLLVVLLPAAILLLSADLWPRLIAGLRASLALLFGAFAVVSGVVAIDRLRVEGFGASALCGVLPLLAGVTLLGIGIRLLWVSRKRGGSWWWTVSRRALLAFAGLLVVTWVVLPVGAAIVATELPREPVKQADLGRSYQEVSLIARDGVRLAAWYVPSQNHAAVITFPRADTIAQARMLVKHGYGVLLVDPRGYGDSEGTPDAYGWGSTKDIQAAVAWLRQRPDVQKRRIGGLGVSTGGEQMIEAAAGNLGLKAVVSEGAGIHSVREVALGHERWIDRLLHYPQELTQTVAVWLLSSEPVPLSLKDASSLISPRAVLFIYGGKSHESEKWANPVYYEAAFEPKMIWKVPGAGHARGLATRPAAYEKVVVGFFDRTLLGQE